MWLTEIYSEGDLLNDDYLQVNKRVEKDEFGNLFETYDDRFTCYDDVKDRVEFIESCIERLKAESDFLKKYDDKLVCLGSYSKLSD